jgi:S1-C subfamily serine protease
MLLIAWAIGSVLTASPFPEVVGQVNNSALLRTMDRVMPAQARTMFSDFRGLLASGPFPQVFSGIGAAHLLNVPAPDQAVLNSPGFLADRNRVVKIQGTAPSCDRSIEGSGFVYAPDHVLTNAHVVAGVQPGPRVTAPDGLSYQAQVVLYDPQIDVAILYVPGLDLQPLSFAGPASSGADAVVAGYPLDHSFTAVAARIGEVQSAVGPDIYQTGTVDREIYEIRAIVQPGNSGGPLIAPNGSVYGVVFAAAVGVPDTGFALTSAEVQGDASAGASATTPVSTQGCD